MIIPIPIFFGVEGSMSLLFSHGKKAITAKVRVTINSGLKD